jgi:hypothetical protein
VSPPWISISNNQDLYFDPEMLPKDVGLAEPSKLKGRDVNALLKHWYERQEGDAHLHALQFSSFLGKDLDIVPCGTMSPVHKEPKKRRRRSEKTHSRRKGKTETSSSESSEGEVFDMDMGSDSDDSNGNSLPTLTGRNGKHPKRDARRDIAVDDQSSTTNKSMPFHERGISPLPVGAKVGPPKGRAKSSTGRSQAKAEATTI